MLCWFMMRGVRKFRKRTEKCARPSRVLMLAKAVKESIDVSVAHLIDPLKQRLQWVAEVAESTRILEKIRVEACRGHGRACALKQGKVATSEILVVVTTECLIHRHIVWRVEDCILSVWRHVRNASCSIEATKGHVIDAHVIKGVASAQRWCGLLRPLVGRHIDTKVGVREEKWLFRCDGRVDRRGASTGGSRGLSATGLEVVVAHRRSKLVLMHWRLCEALERMYRR